MAYQGGMKGEGMNTEKGGRRGFHSLSLRERHEVSSKGGRAAHKKKTCHEWTVEEAREAGRRGGKKTQAKRRRLKKLIPDDPPGM